MNDDARFISKILDDGAPFVIWEQEPKEAFKRGMIVDTWVCDNPDCHFLHFQAVAIDERFKKMGFKGRKFVYTIESELNQNAQPLPHQNLTASIHVESAEVSVKAAAPLENEDQNFFKWVAAELKGDYFNVMKRRWRMARKVNRDRWRNFDWNWWEPGMVVGWNEVFPDDPDFIFTVSGTHFWARDQYCINPGCPCQEITLSFAEFDQEQKPQELGAVSIALKNFRVGGVQPVEASPEKLTRICQKFQKQAGVESILKTRQKEMKLIGKEIVQLSRKKRSHGHLSLSKSGRKVGRNAPCPCGSGKKYKKCCLSK